MAKQLYNRIGKIGVDDLLADPQNHTYTVTDEQIAEGAKFTRGQLVTYDTSTNTVKAVTKASDAPFGIVVDDVNCSEEADENGDLSVRVYVSGAFNAQSELLTVSDSLDINTFYVALRDRGMILRNRALSAD